jgi:uncharacterized protein
VALPPAESLTEAQRLLDAGMPFHAHEILEGTWKAAPESERDLWQGLAQLAVGMTHALRGNRAGARSLLRRGRERIQQYSPANPYGVDVAGLVTWSVETESVLADLDPDDRNADDRNADDRNPDDGNPDAGRSAGRSAPVAPAVPRLCTG